MDRGNTKQEILEAALELFSVQGFEATSISQIASAVGIRKASLYSHFENKQAILDKLRLEQRVTEAVDGMSVATFHQTLNEFMAENFCAVQVLGFILGALVGALQLLARI